MGHNFRRFMEKMAVFFIVTKTDDEPGSCGHVCHGRHESRARHEAGAPPPAAPVITRRPAVVGGDDLAVLLRGVSANLQYTCEQGRVLTVPSGSCARPVTGTWVARMSRCVRLRETPVDAPARHRDLLESTPPFRIRSGTSANLLDGCEPFIFQRFEAEVTFERESHL